MIALSGQEKVTLYLSHSVRKQRNEGHPFENFPLKIDKNIKLVLNSVSTAGHLAF